jgi:hypothetical protein
MIREKNSESSLIPTPPSGYCWLYTNNDELFIKKSNGIVKRANNADDIATIRESNTAWVNLDISASVSAQRIFKSYTEALAWIIANGSPSASNPWQIILPAGNVGNIVISNKYIRIVANLNTVIENLSSTIVFNQLEFLLYTIFNVTINNVSITEGTLVSLSNCIINNISAEEGETGYLFVRESVFTGGNFDRIICPWDFLHCSFYGLAALITNLSGSFDSCFLLNCQMNLQGINDSVVLQKSYWSNLSMINESPLEKYMSIIDCNNWGETSDIQLVGNTKLLMTNSYQEYLTFDLPIASLEMLNSFVENIRGTGTITTMGASSYKKKIGDIDFEDFNASPSQYIAVNFADAIPAGAYLDDLFFVIKERFETVAYGYSGLTINHIEHTDLSALSNTVDTVVNCKPNNRSQNNRDITIISTLSGANTQDWTQGSFEVWSLFKSKPAL